MNDRRWLGLVIVAVAQLMIALDATIVNIALPSAQRALGFADVDRQWVVTAYTLAFGSLLFVGGRIADSASLGRRRALIIGLIGFAIASAISGAAIDLAMLVAARALQGAFAALLAPTALSLLAVMFTEPHERARAFGVYGGIAASGGAIGLLLGGLLAQYVDWRWCLYVNVPVALVAAVGAALVLGQSSTGQPGAQPRVVTAPLPFRLWRIVVSRERGPAYLSSVLAIAGMFGAFLSFTYVLQVVLGFSPLQAGLAFLPLSASTLIVSTQLAPRIAPLVAPRMLMVPGFLVAASGMAVLTQLSNSTAYVSTVMPAEILLGLGIGCVMAPAASLATSGIDPRDAGIASAALNTSTQLGASIGTAVLNSVATAATASYVAAGRGDALAHGYAAAAIVGAVVLSLAALVAASASGSAAASSKS